MIEPVRKKSISYKNIDIYSIQQEHNNVQSIYDYLLLLNAFTPVKHLAPS